jgi:hypothetical protein
MTNLGKRATPSSTKNRGSARTRLLAVISGAAMAIAAMLAMPSAAVAEGNLVDDAATASASGVVRLAGPRPLFQLPFPCGETWRLSTYPGHDDYDIDMTPTSGTAWGRPILASYGGRVAAAGIDGTLGGKTPSNPNGPRGTGGGYYVRIDHGNGWQTLYLHMLERPMVSVGQQVPIGHQLGKVGSTGDSSGPHLHYEQKRDGAKTESYFDGVPSGITIDDRGNSVIVTSHNGCSQAQRTPDINGDGMADILAVYNSGELTWYPNHGTEGTTAEFLSARQLSTAGAFRLMSLGDVNGDGRADIVAVYDSGDLVWYPNNGGDNFLSARRLSSAGAFRLMSMGDVNGDGRADIVAVYDSGDLVWYPNNGDDNFLSARRLSNAGAFRLMSTGDVNGDRRADLLAVYNSGELVWYPNNGDDNFLSARRLSNAGGFRLMAN